ncbi:hypothetical protein RchiOBHm_Chr4g0405461 [Rosa chinensis]|uniref:Uncharacterized protein n=1 Tax=Rosa chinensis TaxID=74649 RepID=A0A2P6QU31_ROSCH|nr:hypothetical protein RchiOBHm_Chr4g0405461 [Rosa chinensis]
MPSFLSLSLPRSISLSEVLTNFTTMAPSTPPTASTTSPGPNLTTPYASPPSPRPPSSSTTSPSRRPPTSSAPSSILLVLHVWFSPPSISISTCSQIPSKHSLIHYGEKEEVHRQEKGYFPINLPRFLRSQRRRRLTRRRPSLHPSLRQPNDDPYSILADAPEDEEGDNYYDHAFENSVAVAQPLLEKQL